MENVKVFFLGMFLFFVIYVCSVLYFGNHAVNHLIKDAACIVGAGLSAITCQLAAKYLITEES